MPTPVSSTVLKAFKVLELFRDHAHLGVAECANLLDLPRPSAHRMLATLHKSGALERSPNGRYRLSLQLFELGSVVPLRRHLDDRSHDALERLVTETGLTAHLAVREGTELIYLAKVHRSKDRCDTYAGQRNALHATGLGKVLLAGAGPRVFAEVVGGGLKRYTPHTITTEARLSVEIEDIRQTGFAYDREERLLGVVCLATAVHNAAGDTIAAISTPAPVERYRGQMNRLRPTLAAAAREIERRVRGLPLNVSSPVDN